MRKSTTVPDIEGYALITRNFKDGKNDGKRADKPWCDHCKRPWYLLETTRQTSKRKEKKSDGGAFQATTSDQDKQSSSSSLSITKEQLEQPLKLRKPQNPTCSVAQTGICFTSIFPSDNKSHSLIVDSGATDHMKSELGLFISYSPCAGNMKVKVVNNSFKCGMKWSNCLLAKTNST